MWGLPTRVLWAISVAKSEKSAPRGYLAQNPSHSTMALLAARATALKGHSKTSCPLCCSETAALERPPSCTGAFAAGAGRCHSLHILCTICAITCAHGYQPNSTLFAVLVDATPSALLAVSALPPVHSRTGSCSTVRCCDVLLQTARDGCREPSTDCYCGVRAN